MQRPVASNNVVVLIVALIQKLLKTFPVTNTSLRNESWTESMTLALLSYWKNPER
ncbi:hypothetical protein HAX54_005512, partial [Datura stramonium]|nr:hypothetical protein [Datura stramonium]